MRVGERRLNVMRVYNAKEGFSRKDDRLPDKFFKPLAGSGPTGGVVLELEEIEAALDHYYQLMGWTEDGFPGGAKLVELGIDWAGQ